MPLLLSEQFSYMEWVVIPALIFIARIFDVSISTLRIMYTINERQMLASLLGFVEVLIWLVAVSQALKHLSTPAAYVAFAGGFATGTYVGMVIEKRLAAGIVLIRIITVKKDSDALVAHLRNCGYWVTVLDAIGNEGHVNVVFLPARRKELPALVEIVQKYNPNALYTIENLRFVSSLRSQLSQMQR
ncbi:MAG: UPF0316 protein [Chitinophagales bacterium]|nr:MAG: UPF0316 protein [Chitinophagales bacterium]